MSCLSLPIRFKTDVLTHISKKKPSFIYLLMNNFSFSKVRMIDRPETDEPMCWVTGDFRVLSRRFISRTPAFKKTSTPMNNAVNRNNYFYLREHLSISVQRQWCYLPWLRVNPEGSRWMTIGVIVTAMIKKLTND